MKDTHQQNDGNPNDNNPNDTNPDNDPDDDPDDNSNNGLNDNNNQFKGTRWTPMIDPQAIMVTLHKKPKVPTSQRMDTGLR